MNSLTFSPLRFLSASFPKQKFLSNQTKFVSFSTHRPEMGKKAKDKQFWLLKTEPGDWSWEDQAANGGVTKWDGVRNRQAQNNLRAMSLDDLCFFYHSGQKSRRIVGVVTVTREWYEDGGGAVDVRAVGEMRRPVELEEMKRDEGLKKGGFQLLRQPRLSVVPVGAEVWRRICDMGGGYEGDGRDVSGDEEAEAEAEAEEG